MIDPSVAREWNVTSQRRNRIVNHLGYKEGILDDVLEYF